MAERPIPSPLGSLPGNEHLVVILGASQSGKTTFTETTKQYALISGTNENPTVLEAVRTEDILTRFPNYHVEDHEKNPETPKIIRPCYCPCESDFILNCEDEYDYEEAIDERGQHLKLNYIDQIDQGSEPASFALLDTPGVTGVAPDGHIEPNLSRVLSISKAIASRNARNARNGISLVLIAVSTSIPLTREFTYALDCCIGTFSGLNSVFAFLHTKIKYENLYPGSSNFLEFQKRRTELQKIIGRPIPEFYIDCDIDHSKRPFRACITYNVIEKILQTATFNQPVMIALDVVNKTPRMKQIDKIAAVTYEKTLEARSDAIRTLNYNIDVNFSQAIEVLSNISKVESKLRTRRNDLNTYQSGNLELLYEDRYDGGQKLGEPEICTMELPVQKHTIDKVDIFHKGIRIEEVTVSGGEGEKSWRAEIPRIPIHAGTFQVRIYCKKVTKYCEEIEQAEFDIKSLEEEVVQLKVSVAHLEESIQSSYSKRRVELGWRNFRIHLIEWLTKDSLPRDTFQALVENEAYTQPTIEAFRMAMEEVYFGMFRDNGLVTEDNRSNILS
ncbi:hypothetical protein BGZ80_010078 [Entomortierella chlamydospora]|uniref:G domain-containing protein n=1 Tax=Entomortierella chlamydospora TaxID=101097 RepID=A0A9P6MVW1_9FUNG|nr:hypothetical protein BGZ79_008373 [Entomortierella chlamydospora]KAG0015053.1 hypothetical protein BGZ80_010078 [Entomortierella chlamydospora]